MEITFNHKLLYTNSEKVTVTEIAESLLANEVLIKHAIVALEDIVDGLSVENFSVYLKEVTQNSPIKEYFAIGLFISYQKDLEKAVPKMFENILHKDIPKEYDTLLTVLVFIVMFYGVDYIFKLLPHKQAQHYPKERDAAMNKAAELLGVSSEKIKEALDKKVVGVHKQSVANAAKKFLAPARRDKSAKIVGGDNYVEISSNAISEMPTDIDYEIVDNEEIQEPYENVSIKIRATDIDRNKSGWAGIISKISNDRLKMEVYPTVNKDKLYGKKSIRGDIILVSKLEHTGVYKPYMFHLIDIRERRRKK